MFFVYFTLAAGASVQTAARLVGTNECGGEDQPACDLRCGKTHDGAQQKLQCREVWAPDLQSDPCTSQLGTLWKRQRQQPNSDVESGIVTSCCSCFLPTYLAVSGSATISEEQVPSDHRRLAGTYPRGKCPSGFYDRKLNGDWEGKNYKRITHWGCGSKCPANNWVNWKCGCWCKALPTTSEPTSDPTAEPTSDPTAEPTSDPTAEPTSDPTAEPTRDPTPEPTPRYWRVANNGNSAWRPAVRNVKFFSDSECTQELTEFVHAEAEHSTFLCSYEPGAPWQTPCRAAFSNNGDWRPQCQNCSPGEAWVGGKFDVPTSVRCVDAPGLGSGSGGGRTWNNGVRLEKSFDAGETWVRVATSTRGDRATISEK